VMLEGKSGRISHEQANARTAKIVAEKTVVDAVLANTESILAEMIAGLGPSSRLAYSCSRMRSGWRTLFPLSTCRTTLRSF